MIIIDVHYFFYKNITKILIFSTITSLIKLLIHYIFNVTVNEVSCLYRIDFLKKTSLFKVIHDMDVNQKKIIFYIMRTKIISSVISNFFLLTLVFGLIPFISSFLIKKFYYIISHIFKSFFLFSLILCLQYSLIEVTFSFFTILKILLHSMFFMSVIYYIAEKKNIVSALCSGIEIIFVNVNLVIPKILVWLIFRWLFSILLKLSYTFPIYINIFLLNILINIYFSYIIIYLFRFYYFSRNRKVFS
ncbi:YciC family protein [Buchnera aphidicola]